MLFDPFCDCPSRRIAEEFFASRDFSYFPQHLNLNDLRYLMSGYFIKLASLDFNDYVHFDIDKTKKELDYFFTAMSEVSQGAYEIKNFSISYIDSLIEMNPTLVNPKRIFGMMAYTTILGDSMKNVLERLGNQAEIDKIALEKLILESTIKENQFSKSTIKI